MIFDRVSTTRSDLPITWLLHTLFRPVWGGAEAPDTSLPPEKQLTLAPDGNTTI